jgi:putative membrane protein
VRKTLKIFFCGLSVGAADIVPGISGGTVAFIIGIYEELLQSIATINAEALSKLLRFQLRAFFNQVAWKFLLTFLFGVSISFITLAKGFNYLLHHETYRTFLYSGFMGLVVGSVIFCSRLLPRFSLRGFLFLSLGAVTAYVLSGVEAKPVATDILYDVPVSITPDRDCKNYDPETKRIVGVPQSALPVMVAKKYIDAGDHIYLHSNGTSVQVSSVIDTMQPSYIDFWIVCCGALAISAMLLPGISGSYLLNVLGMYGIVLGALVDWVEGLKVLVFDLASFRVVSSMALGIALGALCFARVVNYLLANYRDWTLFCLTGFMIGAIGSVWPFWSYGYELVPMHLANGPTLYVESPILPNVFGMPFFISCLFFVGGISAVLFIERIAGKKAACEVA